jgi:hypothetical protein
VSSDVPGNHDDPLERVVDVSDTFKRSEARAILRGFWSRRLLKIGPGLAVLLVAFVRASGPRYVLSILVAVMTIWDHGQLKALCRDVRVRWSPARVQVTNPDGTKPFQWSEVTDCTISRRFLSTSFTNGTTILVPIRAFIPPRVILSASSSWRTPPPYTTLRKVANSKLSSPTFESRRTTDSVIHCHGQPGMASAGLLVLASRHGDRVESESSRTHVKAIGRASAVLPATDPPLCSTT